MFRAQDIEQNMSANLATVNATIADDWSQADVWDGPDLIQFKIHNMNVYKSSCLHNGHLLFQADTL
eukprot:13910749-Ditylum_brightwellii.AAC.1